MRSTLLKWGSLIFIGFLIFSLCSQWVRPHRFFNLSALGLFFPYLYIIALLILPFIFKYNRLITLFYSLVLVVGAWYFMSYINVQKTSEIIPEAPLTVMTYNAMMGVQMVNSKHVMTADIKNEFADLLKKEPAPDVLCVQEVNKVVELLLSSSTEDYPYYHKLYKRGAVILSKYPIVKNGLVDFGAKLNSCLWADIDVHGKIIRVYSAHLESNRLTQESYNMLSDQDYVSDEAISGLKEMIIKYHKYSSVRAEQVLKIKAHSDKSPHPVIIAGDFNDPPVSYSYHVMQQDLNDTYRKKGAGIGTTWKGIIPLLRIDYILSDPSIEIVSYDILKSNLSDHYPIKAAFDLK